MIPTLPHHCSVAVDLSSSHIALSPFLHFIPVPSRGASWIYSRVWSSAAKPAWKLGTMTCMISCASLAKISWRSDIISWTWWDVLLQMKSSYDILCMKMIFPMQEELIWTVRHRLQKGSLPTPSPSKLAPAESVAHVSWFVLKHSGERQKIQGSWKEHRERERERLAVHSSMMSENQLKPQHQSSLVKDLVIL